ncbi:MAG: hypothetical protein M1826_000316 [Phylliscum demangeonii]|nr:MAG: hypothetical protein M1826_000316 [Phylliscum demangeonii]
MTSVDSLLRRPLYVYGLPEEIASTLQPKDQGLHTELDRNEAIPEIHRSKEETAEEGASGTATTSCTLCSVRFEHVQDQRSHARTDFHRYNLKLKLKGLRPVTETEFLILLDDLNESISGSDTSESDDDGDHDELGETASSASKSKDDALAALLRKQAKISEPAPDDARDESRAAKTSKGSGNAPIYWFASPSLPSNVALGIYRAVFTQQEQQQESRLVENLRRKQLQPRFAAQKKKQSAAAVVATETAATTTAADPHFFLCMIGGGHFAAMIISLAPVGSGRTNNHKPSGKSTAGSGASLEDRKAQVVVQKAFHRYTTRRKQGGAQSASDAAKGKAQSAGSSLRRYNEAVLTVEVRELLREWRTMIDSAELLFVRASGSANRRTLYGPYEKPVLRANDARIRSFPFSTKRATQSELLRAFAELTRVKVRHIDEAALLAAAAAAAEVGRRAGRTVIPSSGPAAIQAAAATQVSAEDAALVQHTDQLQSLIRRSKAGAVLSYLTTHNLPPDFRFQPASRQAHHHAPTALHLAASTNAAAVAHALLAIAHANPTLLNGEGKPAFALAGDRATRDAFRVARHQLGERAWAWDAAALVPAPLSGAEAERRAERDRLEDAGRERARREAEMLRLAAEEESARERESAAGRLRMRGGVVVGGGTGRAPLLLAPEKTAAERRAEEARGLTPEMQAKLERERRARAAEDRIRRMQAAGGGGGGGGL